MELFFFSIFFFLYDFTRANADGIVDNMSCLQVLPISPGGALWCTLYRSSFNNLANATLTAVESAATNVANAEKFALTHHPITMAFEWMKGAATQDAAAANAQVEGQAKDIANATIGFGKELANQAVTMVNLLEWADLSFCLIGGAEAAAVKAGVESIDVAGTFNPLSASKRAEQIGPIDPGGQMASIVKSCTTDNWNHLSRPATFNIAGPDQQVGTTMANLALMFTPIGADEGAADAASNLVKDGYDLAIPGNEDAGRVLKMGPKGEAEHFASEAEASAVGSKLDDTDYTTTQCDKCAAPAGPALARRRRSPLFRRTGPLDKIVQICCRAPDTVRAMVNMDNRRAGGARLQGPTLPSASSFPLRRTPSVPVFDPASPWYGQGVPESAIKSGIDVAPFQLWPSLQGRHLQELRYDLEVRGAGQLGWHLDIMRQSLSDAIFPILRSAFSPTTPEAQELASLLEISPAPSEGDWEGRFGAGASSMKWTTMGTSNASLRKLQQWAEPVAKQFKAAWIKVQGVDSARAQSLNAEIRFYYAPPGVGLEPPERGFHTGEESFIFLAQDVAGLVIDEGKNNLSRLKPNLNSWWCLSGRSYRFAVDSPVATKFAEFGPEQARNGRVSIVVRIGESNRGSPSPAPPP